MNSARANRTNDPNATSDLVRDGVVVSVDLGAARAVVDLGDGLVVGPMPWTAVRAGALRVWAPPTEGEQVQVVAPEGDFERARISGSLFSDANAAPASDGSTRIEWEDGTFLAYDAGTVVLGIMTLFKVTAPKVELIGDVDITGKVKITGDVELIGKLEATDDLKAGTVSVKNHVHQQPGSPAVMTGAPKP